MAKNITLAVDEDVLEAVRAYARDNHTSVNALIKEALRGIAEKGQRSDHAWDELFAEIDKEGAEMGQRTWTRDDLYVR